MRRTVVVALVAASGCGTRSTPPPPSPPPSDEQLRGVLERAAPALTACDAAQRTAIPQLATEVELRFFIAPTGSVADVGASTSDVSGPVRELATCARHVIAALHFPPPRGGGGVAATYPIAFHPPRSATLAADRRAAADDVEHVLAANVPAITGCLARANERFLVSLDPIEGAHAKLDDSPGASCIDRALATATHLSTALGISCELAPS